MQQDTLLQILPSINSNTSGGGVLSLHLVLARSSIKKSHQYKVTFGVDTVANLPKYDYGLIYTTNSITVTDKNENNIVYQRFARKIYR